MGWFRRLKLGTKLLSGFLLVALTGAALSLYVLNEQREAVDRSTNMYHMSTLPIWHVGEISTNFHRLRVDLERMVHPDASPADVQSYAEKIAERRDDITKHHKFIEDTAENDAERDILRSYQSEREKFGPVLERAIALAKAGNREEAQRLAHGELDALRKSYQAVIDRMFANYVKEAEDSSHLNESLAASSQKAVLVLIAVVLGLGIGVAFFITSDVKRDVGGEPRLIREFADRIAGGDLTMKSLDDSKVTGINQAVGRMNAALQSIIVPMSAGMSGLAASSEQVTSVAAEVRRSATESTERLSGVAAAAEEMQTNMGSVAAAVEESCANVASVATAAEELTATIQEIAMRAGQARQISDGAVHSAKETGEIIAELAEAAEGIGKVTDTISEISEQTKLLALNATIEAARAGDAGKGFAVVAGEIKELARQVAEATADISKRVNGIRQSTGRTKSGIDSMAGVIHQVNESILTIASAVEQQSATVTEIARSAQEVSTAVSDSASMVSQTSEAARMVAKDVSTLSTEASGLVAATSQLDQSSEELTRMASEMQQLVGRFRV